LANYTTYYPRQVRPRLHHRLPGPTLPNSENREVLKIVLPAFNREMAKDNRTLAILSTEVNARMLVQLSAFTIHGNAQALERAAESPVFLKRFTIAAADKGYLRDGLDMLGIHRSSLFPDLQNLAGELADASWAGPPEFKA
jgi:hypothetical protein